MGISIHGLQKWYLQDGQQTSILKDIDLEIQDGEFFSIVGPSGCGKSTLLTVIAGLDSANEGELRVNGAVVDGPGRERAMVFQDSALFPWLTVRQNVEFGLKMRDVPFKERRERSLHFLKMVHLGSFMDRYPKQLSGGQKQRVSIARALTLDPDILLMDEPFAALDAQTRLILTKELQDIWLQTKKTIVFVTHSVEEALLLSDRVGVMTAKPGMLKQIYTVEQSHPRDTGDPYLVALNERIMEFLEHEIAEVARGEVDEDWNVSLGHVPAKPDSYMGDSI